MTKILDEYDDLLGLSNLTTPLDHARNLLVRGFAVVPIPARQKGPVLKDWGNLRLDASSAAQHFGGEPRNIGVILGAASNNLVDIDLDSPEAIALAPSFLPATDAMFGRASTPRSHWLYRAPELTTTKIMSPETRDTLVELRSNTAGQPSQTVFPGSVHPSGERIEWSSDGEPTRVDPVILLTAFNQLGAASILARHFPSAGGRHDATLALCGFLARCGWQQATIARFVKTVRDCVGADNRKRVEAMARDAIQRLAGDRTLFGLASLRNAFGTKVADRAAELIGFDPAWNALDADAIIAELEDLDPLGDHPGDPVVARLNRRHAVVSVRGRTLITTERTDGSVDFGTVRDLETFYANDRLPAGKGKVETAATRWLRSLDRRTYPDGVTFAPGGAEPGTLNLWRGWAVEPDPAASCDRFLDHILQVVCRGDGDHAAYLLNWLAHLVQRPDEKPGVAIVMRGEKGTGKDTVADYVTKMIGRRHAPTVAESDHIVGKFNSRLENALLLHVQEGSWAGDRRAESVLKYLVTSDRIEIERKGIDSFNIPSVLRLFISANASWVVPASADERRWAVFETSSARRGDDAYFRALRGEMNGSGPAALLHHLRERDVSIFNVRQAPETEGLINQKVASLRGINLWWFELLNRGTLQDWDCSWIDAAQAIGRDVIRARYLDWCKGRRFDGDPIDEARFGKLLREMLPALENRRPRDKRSGRISQYLLPSLAASRAAFEGWIGGSIAWEAA